ncbi:hypothetical protein [Sulfuricurvum sp.]|uniref:hypothetical protein n=1 Tax=Sulfuricurvum sp. TaxID=2025608 RepID=UPI002603D7A2|nr:hypothetical protein [Sulfuricurvum sp.]MDD2781475.1 hypothetical protein [Sulfuricurvum sp.]
MNRERYLVKSNGDNIEGTRVGLINFLELCQKYGNGVIVVPMLQNVNHSMLTTVLGEELSKKLIKNRTLAIENGKTISLCSANTLKNYTYANVYLALWGSKDTIQVIEKTCHNGKAIVLVTWIPEDSKDWISQNAVTIVYDDNKD